MAFLIKDIRLDPATGKRTARYRIGDRVGSKQITGQIGFVSEKEAKQLLRAYEQRRAAGETPEAIWQRGSSPTSDLPTPPATKLLELWHRYAAHMEAQGAARATLDSAKYAWRAWEPEIGTAEAAALTQATVDAVVIGWRRAEISDRTIQIRVLLLRRMLAQAATEGLIPTAPTIKVPPVREQRPHRWLDPQQQAALVAALPWATAPASSWAIWLCLELGLRIGEATSRRWADVDWRRSQLRVGAGAGFEVKTRRERWLPLAPAVVERLRTAYDGLPAEGRDEVRICPVSDIRKALLSACERAGVPPIHPHGLRHSWASRLATDGVDRPTLMALGGWTSGEMLDEVYAHAHTSHVRDQVARTALAGAVVELPATLQVSKSKRATQGCYPELLPSTLIVGRRR